MLEGEKRVVLCFVFFNHLDLSEALSGRSSVDGESRPQCPIKDSYLVGIGNAESSADLTCQSFQSFI
jgi:hypothetical protein